MLARLDMPTGRLSLLHRSLALLEPFPRRYNDSAATRRHAV
jgi:hypothetical protein